jgi:hypothetical protein
MGMMQFTKRHLSLTSGQAKIAGQKRANQVLIDAKRKISKSKSKDSKSVLTLKSYCDSEERPVSTQFQNEMEAINLVLAANFNTSISEKKRKSEIEKAHQKLYGVLLSGLKRESQRIGSLFKNGAPSEIIIAHGRETYRIMGDVVDLFLAKTNPLLNLSPSQLKRLLDTYQVLAKNTRYRKQGKTYWIRGLPTGFSKRVTWFNDAIKSWKPVTKKPAAATKKRAIAKRKPVMSKRKAPAKSRALVAKKKA